MEYIILVGVVGLVALVGFRSFGQRVGAGAQGYAACVASLDSNCGAGRSQGVVGSAPIAMPASRGSSQTAAAANPGSAAAAAQPASATAPGEPASPPAPAAAGQAQKSGEPNWTIPETEFLMTNPISVDTGKFFYGGIKQQVSGVTAAYDVIKDPADTWEGLKYTAQHPILAGKAVYQAMKTEFKENPWQSAGAAVSEVLTLPWVVGKIGLAPKAAAAIQATRLGMKIVKAGEKAAEVAKIERLKKINDVADKIDKVSTDEDHRHPTDGDPKP